MDLSLPDHADDIGGDLGVAAAAALAAGQVIADGATRLHTVEVEQKGAGDLVSEIDRAADRAAAAVLQQHSDAPLLSEELQPDAPQTDDMWIVDPLDATGAYLMQVGPALPAVLIARRRGGQTTCGVCLFPLTGEWFYAMRDEGAWQDGRELQVTEPRKLGDVWVETNQYGDARRETARFRKLLDRLRSPRGAGLVTCNAAHSGVAARIAAGNSALSACVHDNSPDDVKQAPWDIAAPQLILEQAGGVCWNLQGEPVDPFVAEVMIYAQSASLANEVLELSRARAVEAP